MDDDGCPVGVENRVGLPARRNLLVGELRPADSIRADGQIPQVARMWTLWIVESMLVICRVEVRTRSHEVGSVASPDPMEVNAVHAGRQSGDANVESQAISLLLEHYGANLHALRVPKACRAYRVSRRAGPLSTRTPGHAGDQHNDEQAFHSHLAVSFWCVCLTRAAEFANANLPPREFAIREQKPAYPRPTPLLQPLNPCVPRRKRPEHNRAASDAPDPHPAVGARAMRP
jgi:hypothetical protein